MADEEAKNDREWTAARIAALECVDRGEGLKPCHVYVDGSGRCQCGHGPDLNERKMK
jgi:hypothetical protein